ncbi:hypothetical protein GCM10025874_21520 [Arenivirga flava]|uniref:DUF2254 domain-containing protein n=2 Tax=Arenivirga flava TaxID=1930060 RepID=A0AA37UES5_9MICO|nr:hypothetical protein GCM10025874_21520 [Arenivirga flava]
MTVRTTSSLRLALSKLFGKVGTRAAVFGVIAIAFALAAGLIGAALPVQVGFELGQNSVDSLLQIIATAMLTATTFSITAMVTAYSSAATNGTPRATQLLVADPTSQNSLSTFVGAFVFAMVGIIALSTGYYTEQGRIILFLGTLIIIAIVVVTLMRWIAHLAQFGRMADIIDRVERAASDSLTAYAERPTLGARPLETIPAGTHPVAADEIGYVVHIDIERLQRIATKQRMKIFILADPGRTAEPGQPLCRASKPLDDDTVAAIRNTFSIAAHRTYDQDPRIGIIALGEIGTRALSPATNDPGTAIEVIAALHRVFTRALRTERSSDLDFDRVYLTAPHLESLVDDAFRPLARDGAAMIEVQIRLQKTLAALAVTAPQRRHVFRTSSTDALRRARAAMNRSDYRALRTAITETGNRSQS